MGQDSFIHETTPANINTPQGENLSVFRKAGIVRNPADAAAPFQVLHPDGYLEPLATAAGGAGVQTVTGYNVDNTDPANPVILPVEVDGVTITGTGVIGDPFVAVAPVVNAWMIDGNVLGAKRKMGSIDAFDVGFITTNIERMTILDTGEVGIGTTAPAAPLHVHAVSGELLRLSVDAFGDGFINFRDDVFDIGRITVKRSTGNQMFIEANGGIVVPAGVTMVVGFSSAGSSTFTVVGDNALTYAFAVSSSGGAAEMLFVTNTDMIGFKTSMPETDFDFRGTAQMRRANDATGVSTLQPSNILQWQGAYWDGAASQNVLIKSQLVVDSVVPAYHLEFRNLADVDLFSIHDNGNISIGPAPTFGGGLGVLFVANGTAPSADPVGGGLLYSEAGAGKWRGTSGTITTFGPAEPHCPCCGSDFMHEWESDKYGYLAVCMKCVTKEIGEREFILTQKTKN